MSGEERAPRLGPDELIARGVRGRGVFSGIDPMVPGRVWSRWEWAGLAAWAVVAGLRGWRLWRRTRPFEEWG